MVTPICHNNFLPWNERKYIILKIEMMRNQDLTTTLLDGVEMLPPEKILCPRTYKHLIEMKGHISLTAIHIVSIPPSLQTSAAQKRNE